MSIFWRNFMSLWSGIVILFGLVLAGAGFAATDAATFAIWDLFGAPTLAMDSNHRFAIGLMGAVTMGWGCTYYVTFQALHRLSPTDAAPLWRLLTAGAILWFIVDSTISIKTGIAFNAVSNTLLIILYLVPVLTTGVLNRDKSGAAATT